MEFEDKAMDTVYYKRLAESAKLPVRQHPGDVGYDLYLSRDLEIDPLGFTDAHTDLAISLPQGYWCMITGRSSSIRNHGVLVTTGIIDNGYTGPLHIAVQNLRDQPFRLEAGNRIAQLIIHRIYNFAWKEVNLLPETDRGDQGFGSTGK